MPAEINQIVEEVIIDDSKATAGAERVVSAFRKLEGASVTLTGVQTSAERAVSRWAAAADPAVAAAQRLGRAETDLTRAVRQGVIDQERQVVILDQLRARMAGGQTAARGMGGAFQNASFQIADFAVQVGGGTSAIRALSQQLPQLLGGFGLWGAAAGAVVAIGGALITKYVDFGETANQAAAEQEAFNATLERASDLMDEINGKAERTRESLLAERSNVIGVAEIQVENAQAAVAAAEARIRFLMDAASEKATQLRLRDDLSLTEPRDALKQAQQELTLLKATLGEFDDGRSRMGVRDQDLIDQLAQDDKRKAEEAAREADRRRREQERAEEAFGRSFESLVAKIDPVAAAQRELAKDTEVLGGAMARGIPIAGGYAAALEKLGEAYRDKLDPAGAALRKLTEAQDLQRDALNAETAAIGMSADERAVYVAGLQAEAALRKANVPMTSEGADAYIAEARAIEQARQEQERLKGQLEASDGAAKQVVGTITDGFGEAARSIAKAGFNLEELGSIGERVLNRLVDLFVELAYVNPLENSLGLNPTPAPTLASVGPQILGMFGSIFGGSTTAAAATPSAASITSTGSGMYPFEQGGIMTPRGPLPLHRYEGGGIADSPQVAIYGEGRRPEAYVPLPDGRTIPVTMRMAGGGAGNDNASTGRTKTVNVRQTINLPPQANGFGRSPKQMAGAAAQSLATVLRDV